MIMDRPRTGARAGRSGLPAAGWAAALVLTALTAGCTSAAPPTASDPAPSDVVSSLGAVPIPPTGSTLPTSSARPGHPAVLAIGEPVVVTPPGVEAVVTALGPGQILSGPQPGPDPITPASITVQVQARRGTLTLGTAELSSKDEIGTEIRLKPKGPTSVTVRPGQKASVTVGATYHSGSAQITWTHDGQPLAVWTFTIELD